MNGERKTIRLSEANQQIGNAARWRRIFSNPPLLMHSIIILQRTLRMAKMLGTWDAFMQTEYYFDMARAVGNEGVAFFRAWWELLADVAPGRDATRNECEFIMAVLTARQMAVGYATAPKFTPHDFQLGEEHGERIREACLLKFKDLVK